MVPDKFTKELLLRTATEIYAVTKPFMKGSDGEMMRDLARSIKDKYEAGEATRAMMAMGGYYMTHEGQLNIVGFSKWAHCGFPTITMGHKYAAALLSTSASPEAIDLARPPFPAFMIELPDKFLDIDDPNISGGRMWLRRLLVMEMEGDRGRVWGYVAYTDGTVSMYRHGQKTDELMPPTMDDEVFGDENDPFNYEVTDRDARVLILLGRLIVNTCLAMSDPSLVKAVGRSHKDWEKRSNEGPKRNNPQPVVRIFQVGKPVQHDLREAVGEYVNGQRRKLTVQVLVRGHYKTQHYGRGNSQIKTIWREPFWRGPEDAPIPLRPHNLGE
jgi:hypothetical protein